MVVVVATRQSIQIWKEGLDMSFSGYSLDDEAPAWGLSSPPTTDPIRDALRREQILKFVVPHNSVPSTFDNRFSEILQPLNKTSAVNLFYSQIPYFLPTTLLCFSPPGKGRERSKRG